MLTIWVATPWRFHLHWDSTQVISRTTETVDQNRSVVRLKNGLKGQLFFPDRWYALCITSHSVEQIDGSKVLWDLSGPFCSGFSPSKQRSPSSHAVHTDLCASMQIYKRYQEHDFQQCVCWALSHAVPSTPPAGKVTRFFFCVRILLICEMCWSRVVTCCLVQQLKQPFSLMGQILI